MRPYSLLALVWFLPLAVISQCPLSASPGTYCPTGGGPLTPCSIGTFCPGGTTQPQPCIPAMTCPTTGLAAQHICSWSVGTIAGNASRSGGTNGVGNQATFFQARGITVRGDGALIVANSGLNTIRAITPSTSTVTNLAGVSSTTGGSLDGPSASALFNNPTAVASSGVNVYVGDSKSCAIRLITGGITVSTVAGKCGTGVVNGIGTAAVFSSGLNGIALDRTNANMYVADSSPNHVIRLVNLASKVVTTFAGVSMSGSTTDGASTSATFNNPHGVVASTNLSGDVFVAEFTGQVIRRVRSGVVTTVAGLALTSGSVDGVGTGARFNNPVSVAMDSSGVLFVAESSSFKIRMILIQGSGLGSVTTLAGMGVKGSANGPALTASFTSPFGIALSPTALYIGDNSTVRNISCVLSAASTTSPTPTRTITSSRSPTRPASPIISPTPTLTPSKTKSGGGGGGGGSGTTPTPTISPSRTRTISPTTSPSRTVTGGGGGSGGGGGGGTTSPTPSATPTPTPSLTPSITSSTSPSLTPSLTPSSTPTPTPTSTISPGSSPTNTPSTSPSPSNSDTPSPTPSVTPSDTPSPPPLPSSTPSATVTPSPSITASPGGVQPQQSLAPSPSPSPSTSPTITSPGGGGGGGGGSTSVSSTRSSSASSTATSTATATTTATTTPSPTPSTGGVAPGPPAADAAGAATPTIPVVPVAVGAGGGGVLLLAGAAVLGWRNLKGGKGKKNAANPTPLTSKGGAALEMSSRVAAAGGGAVGGTAVVVNPLASAYSSTAIKAGSASSSSGGGGGSGSGNSSNNSKCSNVWKLMGPDEEGECWYENAAGDSSWDLPEGGTCIPSHMDFPSAAAAAAAAAAVAVTAASAPSAGVWKLMGPDEEGETWYENAAGDSVWDLPQGGTLIPSHAYFPAAAAGGAAGGTAVVVSPLASAFNSTAAKAGTASSSSSSISTNVWKLMGPDEEGECWYQNVAGDSAWDLPKGGTVIPSHMDFPSAAAVIGVGAGGAAATAATAPSAPSGGVWSRVEDGNGDVWYENSVTGESAWDLPTGVSV